MTFWLLKTDCKFRLKSTKNKHKAEWHHLNFTLKWNEHSSSRMCSLEQVKKFIIVPYDVENLELLYKVFTTESWLETLHCSSQLDKFVESKMTTTSNFKLDKEKNKFFFCGMSDSSWRTVTMGQSCGPLNPHHDWYLNGIVIIMAEMTVAQITKFTKSLSCCGKTQI